MERRGDLVLFFSNSFETIILPSETSLFELFASVERLSVFEESNVICADIIDKIHA